MQSSLGEYKEIIVARATDEEIRSKRKRSGGAVTAILIYLLESKILDGVVIVKAKEGLQTEVVVARNREEMLIAAANEWPVAPNLRMMKEAIAEKEIQDCGVIVTPCQAQGIRLMQEYPMTETDLGRNIKMIVGSFCYGTFTHTSFRTFLKEKQGLEPADVKRVEVTSEFLEITLKNGKRVEIATRDVLTHVQSGCLICHDLTAAASDISTGVIPTRPRFTTLIVRTQFGQEVVKEAIKAQYLEIAPLEIGRPFIENMIKDMAEEKIRRAQMLWLVG